MCYTENFVTKQDIRGDKTNYLSIYLSLFHGNILKSNVYYGVRHNKLLVLKTIKKLLLMFGV